MKYIIISDLPKNCGWKNHYITKVKYVNNNYPHTYSKKAKIYAKIFTLSECRKLVYFNKTYQRNFVYTIQPFLGDINGQKQEK